MKHLIFTLIFLGFLLSPVFCFAEVATGVQIPSGETINRLIPSQYSFGWLKFQYSLGSSQPLESWIKTATTSKAGKGANYKVLISVAKNQAGIETLSNPPYSPLFDCPDGGYTSKYCPWDNELETKTCQRCHNETQPDGTSYSVCEDYSITARPKTDNGYIKFRDKMKDLAPLLNKVDALEIWNEPNLAVEWSEQNLGPINPENYANFLLCGIKGLNAGSSGGKFQGTIISAGLAPLAPDDGKNMNDFTFFDRFYNYLSSQKKLGEFDAFGWHSNVTSNLPPNDPSDQGFQRVKHALGKGKPVWLTEFGWKRKDDTDAERQKQAGYVAQAYGVAEKLGIPAMFVWNFGFSKADPAKREEFVLWDIEGTIPEGIFCLPNTEIDPNNRKERGDTKYVQDTTLADDDFLASIAAKALIPKVINDDIASKSANISETKIDVTESFFNNIPGVLGFLKGPVATILNIRCGLSGIPVVGGVFVQYCTPTISVGLAEKTDNGIAPGANTGKLADKTTILGKVAVPENMELIPARRDCNLGKFSETDQSLGDEKLNETSSGLGTSAGFYGTDQPDFNKLTPEEYQASLEERMNEENLNIGNKLFNQDQRSPDVYLRKQIMCKGYYPNDICPFEPTPAANI